MALPDVAAVLRDHRISGAPVVDGTGVVVGLISEFDLLARTGRTAEEVMTRSVISVSAETGVDEVRDLLVQRRIQRVPVLAGAALIGIVSRSDVIALLVTEWVCEVCGETVRGQHPPQSCPKCRAGSDRFTLQDPDPGS
jgi:CBS-domain-containing membrane protein